MVEASRSLVVSTLLTCGSPWSCGRCRGSSYRRSWWSDCGGDARFKDVLDAEAGAGDAAVCVEREARPGREGQVGRTAGPAVSAKRSRLLTTEVRAAIPTENK